jgi:hypothetical protein
LHLWANTTMWDTFRFPLGQLKNKLKEIFSKRTLKERERRKEWNSRELEVKVPTS